MYNYNYTEDYLMHYGVKGMKWGVRRASKLQAKANIARDSAKEWDEMASYARAKGASAKSARRAAKFEKKAAKYESNAAQDRADAAKIQKKADAKVEKRYAKAGEYAGAADYARSRAKQIEDNHNKGASALDKTANRLDSEGKHLRAEAARASAQALRNKGANDASRYRDTADAYMKKSDKLNKKAKDFATTTNINVGKKKIDSVLASSRKAGYKNAQLVDEIQRDIEVENRYGTTAADVYKKVRK